MEYAVTENRFNQCIAALFGDPRHADVKRLGEVIKWMQQDILKEESDTMAANGIDWKEVTAAISAKTRTMFFGLAA